MSNSLADAQFVAIWKSHVLGVLAFLTYLHILFHMQYRQGHHLGFYQESCRPSSGLVEDA